MEESVDIRKIVDDYFRNLGINKAYDLKKILVLKYGKEKAKRLLFELERLEKVQEKRKEESGEALPSEQTEKYNFLNADFKMSMSTGAFYDADIWKKSCIWLAEHKEHIASPAIEIGCGNGIITCFLASFLPDVQFIGIDRAEKPIMIANQLKENLSLRNVTFEVAKAEDIKETYSTVLSFRTFHENIGCKYVSYKFESFTKQIELYGGLYKNYAGTISRLIKQNGKLLFIERFTYNTDFLALLDQLNSNGLQFDQQETKLILCKESDLREETRLIASSLKKEESLSDDVLFERWASLAFDENGKSDSYADYLLENKGGKLVYGYSTFDSRAHQCGLFGIYEVVDDPSVFMLYQANAKQASLQIYPMFRKAEAIELLDRTRDKDAKNGFSINVLS